MKGTIAATKFCSCTRSVFEQCFGWCARFSSAVSPPSHLREFREISQYVLQVSGSYPNHAPGKLADGVDETEWRADLLALSRSAGTRSGAPPPGRMFGVRLGNVKDVQRHARSRNSTKN